MKSGNNEEWHVDLLSLLKRHGRSALLVAVAAAGVAGVAGVFRLWTQPLRVVSTLGFRPVFRGADQGQYPNALPFAASDVVARSILDAVFATNKVADFCDREAFGSGFFVDEKSDESALLDSEFQSRLAEPRLTVVDRERIQAEYQARRNSLSPHFQLTFVRPAACKGIPDVVVSKAMNDALLIWAEESDVKRGVMRHQNEVLSAAVLDLRTSGDTSPFIRAGMIRNALTRITENVESVRQIPGAPLVRLGKEQLTFLEVHGRLIDLFTFRLVPAMVAAARVSGDGVNARAWILEAVATAERDQAAAEGRAAAYGAALRDYTGAGAQGMDSNAGANQSAGRSQDGEKVSVNVDRSFIDFVMGLSKEQAAFRKQLAENMVEEQKAAVTAKMNAEAYRRLLPEALRGGASTSAADVDTELQAVVAEGKVLANQFNQLSDEFARVSLRPATAIYRIERPMSTTTVREFTLVNVLVAVAAMFVVGLVLAFGVLAFRGRAVVRQA